MSFPIFKRARRNFEEAEKTDDNTHNTVMSVKENTEVGQQRSYQKNTTKLNLMKHFFLAENMDIAVAGMVVVG